MMLGYSITQPNDPLQKTSLEHIVRLIKNPPDDIVQKISLLRNLKITDLQAYKTQKKKLPYFVNSIFHPPLRKIENFALAGYFVVDLDNLGSIQKNPNDIKEIFSQNPDVCCIFTSPGQEGIKLIFKFSKPCKDPNEYKSFYKIFIKHLAAQYNLHTVVDFKTNDVTRATFLSYDPDIYYNADARSVDWLEYIHSNPSPDEFCNTTDEEQKTNSKTPPVSADPDHETLLKIKEILGTKSRAIKKSDASHAFVPEKLKNVLPMIFEKIEKDGIKVVSHTPINYGIQAIFNFNNVNAMLNIFYGKKGFSIVPVLRKDTNFELASEIGKLVRICIDELENNPS